MRAQYVSRSGEKGRTASFWLVGESRLLYVRTVEKHNNEAFSYRLTKRNQLSAIYDGPPLSPERKTFRMLSLISFCILTLCKKKTFCFTPSQLP